jgi:hypothetical protein
LEHLECAGAGTARPPSSGCQFGNRRRGLAAPQGLICDLAAQLGGEPDVLPRIIFRVLRLRHVYLALQVGGRNLLDVTR